MEDDKSQKNQKRNGGAFQSMGLSPHIYKAIVRMGYKLPTPIQRKVIPFALDGRDIVAMARTGSGKTASFMIPVVERLQSHSLTVGCRALVMSPARELAMQISSYARKLCKFSDLRVALLVGGASMENQFETLASNPDIIIATPGRIVHHMDEVKSFSLKALNLLVFDEADRLFEMGFAEQLSHILHAAPPSRQVMLVSATMPTQLADFARAGLRDPAVIRLDAEHTLSDNLATWFLMVRPEQKVAALLNVIRKAQELLDESPNAPTVEDAFDDAAAAAIASGEVSSALDYTKKHVQRNQVNKQTKRLRNVCVFCCSRHHVEYIGQILQQCGLAVALVYGNMDQEARNKAVSDFRYGKVQILVTTDVAARGIDLPMLDTVVNFDFPTSAKLFVHRVGRTARAGRSGLAVSLMTLQDLPYVVDLLTFLGKKFIGMKEVHDPLTPLGKMGNELIIGAVPVHPIDAEKVALLTADPDIATLYRSMEAAFKLYLKTRESASVNGVRRSKELLDEFGGPMEIVALPHPAFREKRRLKNDMNQNEIAAEDWLASLRNFRPSTQVNSAKHNVLSSLDSLNLKRYEKEDVTKAASALAAMSDKTRLKTIGMMENNDSSSSSSDEEEDDDWTSDEEESSVSDEIDDENAHIPATVGIKRSRQKDSSSSSEDEEDEEVEMIKRSIKKPRTVVSAPTKGVGSAIGDILASLKAKTNMSEIFDAHRFKSENSFLSAEVDLTKEERQRAFSLNQETFNILGDDGREMMKNKSVRKWDAKKKKYIIVTVDAAGRVVKDKSQRKNEAGKSIGDDKKKKAAPGELYSKWEKRSLKRVGAVGELEDPAAALRKNGKLRRSMTDYENEENDHDYSSNGGSDKSLTRSSLAAKMKAHPLYKTSSYSGIVEAFENKWKLTHKQERKLDKLRQAVDGSRVVTVGGKKAGNELETSATKLAAKRKELEQRKIKQSPALRRKASMESRTKHMAKMQDRMDKRGAHKRSFALVKGGGDKKGGKGRGKKGGRR